MSSGIAVSIEHAILLRDALNDWLEDAFDWPDSEDED